MGEAINKSLSGNFYVSGSFLSNRGKFSKKQRDSLKKNCAEDVMNFGVSCGKSEEEEEAMGKGKASSRICWLSFSLVSANGEENRGSRRKQTW